MLAKNERLPYTPGEDDFLLETGTSESIVATVTGFGDNPIFSWASKPDVSYLYGVTSSGADTSTLTISATADALFSRNSIVFLGAEDERIIKFFPSLEFRVKSSPDDRATRSWYELKGKNNIENIAYGIRDISHLVFNLAEGARTLDLTDYFVFPARYEGVETAGGSISVLGVNHGGFDNTNLSGEVSNLTVGGRLLLPLSPIALSDIVDGGINSNAIILRSTGTNDARVVVTATVTDRPVLRFATTEQTAVSVAENTTEVAYFSAPHQAHYADSYAISGGADRDLFSISATTGLVSFSSAPDFENLPDATTPNSYEVTITATSRHSDGSTADITLEQTILVSVSNENEAGPTDITLSPNSVAGNVRAGTTVGTFTPTDLDADGDYIYTLVSGNGDSDNDSFTIVDDTLTINAVPDRATQASYTIRVNVNDGVHNYAKELTVTVAADLDAPSITTSVMELTARAGTQIEPITITSSGGAVDSYSISPDINTNTGLTFDDSNGTISGTPTTVADALTYTITATNTTGTATATVAVTVIDNDRVHRFTLDIDNSGEVTRQDAIMILRYLLTYRGAEITANQSSTPFATVISSIGVGIDSRALDVDNSGEVTSQDAIMILRYLLTYRGADITANQSSTPFATVIENIQALIPESGN